ncbi:MAG: tripartite tricarboxylate transporter permease [Chloroflexi bacterium]|nr:tripartite tricarboxylate transporter permease [Chloroflexota bacterium]
MIDGLIAATIELMAWPGPAIMLVGVLAGLLVGVLPGVGGAGATALLLPVTYAMEPVHAIGFLMAVGTSSGLGGQITSILVNIPGDPPNAATTLDGYPMTRQGRAAEALGAATAGSVVGAVLGVVLLLAVLPITREIVLAFSYPEFFMIALSGLVMIAALTRGNTFKGLLSAGVGLLIAFIGLDPINGAPRFTFGQLYLWDGIDLTPALVGLFAGAEMLALYQFRGDASIVQVEDGARRSRQLDGVVATVRAWRTVVMSSLIGFVVGVIPGIGGTVASFLSYGRAARMSDHPERFGKGAVEGVIASETANDADKGGALLPTIAFGIPGGTMMAVLMVGLILHGVPVGPSLMRGDNLTIVYALVVALLLPRMVAALIVLAVGGRAVALTRIPGSILAPIISVVAIVGVYAVRNSMLDVVVALVFSYVGYAMQRHGFSRVALIIALVLGALVERSYHQTMATFGPAGFISRPIAVALLVLILLTLFGGPLLRLVRRIKARDYGGTPA